MKVLVAHNRYASASPSGENVVVDAEIDLLRAAGLDVVPYLPSSDQLAQLSPAGKIMLPVGPVYARQGLTDIAALLRRERPDVLHLHNPYPLISPAVVRTAHRHGVPVVQTVHNYRHVCVKGTFFRDERDCHDCAGKTFPVPAVRHGCYRGSRLQSVPMAVSLAVHRGTWREVDRYVALTPAIEEHLVGTGVARDRIVVKPNSAPDPGYHAQAGAGLLYVGRLAEEKGVLTLLEAWRRYPQGSQGVLRIAGEGPLRGAVERAVAGRIDVELLGRLTPAEVQAAMRAAAAVVVPSMWDEVCPMVVVEALANARPVLASARGGLPYLVGDDGGWVVDPTVDAFTAALPAAAAPIGAERAAAARRRYDAMFAPDVVTRRLLAAYSEVVR